MSYLLVALHTIAALGSTAVLLEFSPTILSDTAVQDADLGDGVLCFDPGPALHCADQQLRRLHVFMAGHHANAGQLCSPCS